MDINILNKMSLILLLFMFALSYILDKDLLFESFIIDNYLLFIIEFLIYFCFHEVLHGFSYVIHGANFKSITYGMALEKSVLYCLCKENISKKNILISLIYPFVFIGIITYIIALIYKIPILYLLSICNISGCIGDILMFNFIIKLNKDVMYSEFDEVTSFGIYTNKDISKLKHFGLKYIGTRNELEKNNFKKINISKTSYIGIFILLILGFISFI